MKPRIFSEIGPIEKVYVYSPGNEHNLVLPSDIQPYITKDENININKDFLLFDDIIDLKIAKKQHESFRDIINFYKTDSCIDLRNDFLSISENENILSKYPLINLMYPRDIAAIIGNQIYLTSSSSDVRKTENLLSENFFCNKPEFKESDYRPTYLIKLASDTYAKRLVAGRVDSKPVEVSWKIVSELDVLRHMNKKAHFKQVYQKSAALNFLQKEAEAQQFDDY